MDSKIKSILEEYAQRYETSDFLHDDPSRFMHQVEGRQNKEVAAFVASCLSYGSRKQFMPKIQALLDYADNDMYNWIKQDYYKDSFKEDDWFELMKHIGEKNIMWKKRLVYCLGGNNRNEDVNIILNVIDTGDMELFVMCIDALNEMITEKNKSKILCHKYINRALELIPKSGAASKNILERFVQR